MNIRLNTSILYSVKQSQAHVTMGVPHPNNLEVQRVDNLAEILQSKDVRISLDSIHASVGNIGHIQNNIDIAEMAVDMTLHAD